MESSVTGDNVAASNMTQSDTLSSMDSAVSADEAAGGAASNEPLRGQELIAKCLRLLTQSQLPLRSPPAVKVLTLWLREPGGPCVNSMGMRKISSQLVNSLVTHLIKD